MKGRGRFGKAAGRASACIQVVGLLPRVAAVSHTADLIGGQFPVRAEEQGILKGGYSLRGRSGTFLLRSRMDRSGEIPEISPEPILHPVTQVITCFAPKLA